jgi:hypothetical protein
MDRVGERGKTVSSNCCSPVCIFILQHRGALQQELQQLLQNAAGPPHQRILGESASQQPPARLLPRLVSLLLPHPHARVSPPPSSRTSTPPRIRSHTAAALRCRCSRSLPRRRPFPAMQAAAASTSGRSRGRCRRKARWPPGGGRRPPPPLRFPGGRILQRGSSFSSFPRRPDLAAGLLLFFLPPAADSANPGQCGLRGARPGLRLRFPSTVVTASSPATGSRPRLARLAADDLLLHHHPLLCCYCPCRWPCSGATGLRRRPRPLCQGFRPHAGANCR